MNWNVLDKDQDLDQDLDQELDNSKKKQLDSLNMLSKRYFLWLFKLHFLICAHLCYIWTSLMDFHNCLMLKFVWKIVIYINNLFERKDLGLDEMSEVQQVLAWQGHGTGLG